MILVIQSGQTVLFFKNVFFFMACNAYQDKMSEQQGGYFQTNFFSQQCAFISF